MQVAVTFRHMDASPALRDYASEKFQHVARKYLRSPLDAKVVLEVEKFWHIAKFSLSVRGLTVKSEEKSEDMYSSIDLALDKMERQLRRYKDKIRDHKPVAGVPERPFTVHVIAPVTDEAPAPAEPDADATAEDLPLHKDGELADPSEFGYIDVSLSADGDTPETHVTVLRSRMHSAQPMTTAEAIMQLDLQSMAFLVFTHADSGSINVVYRRDDGNYGLIETESVPAS